MVFEQDGIIVAVHEGATMNFEENAAVGFNAKFINDGTVTVAKQIETRQSGVVINNNDFTAQNYVLTNTSVLVNNDYLHLLSGHRMNSNSTLVNNGTIQADVEFASNNQTVTVYNNNLIKTPFFNYGSGGGVLYNACRIECEDLMVEGSTINNGDGALILCQDIEANNSTFNLTGGSVIKSMDLGQDLVQEVKYDGVTFKNGIIINGIMVGTVSPLFINWKIIDKTNGSKVLTLNGNLEFAVTTGSIPPARYFDAVSDGVTMTNIPVSTIDSTSCNLGGINTGGGGSGDGDDDNGGGGTPPTDPNFPIEVVEGTDYVYSMEDLWPHMGDYDMNDFVFKIHAITKYVNSSNKVEKMTFQLTPLASGSTKLVSAALQLDGVAEGGISIISSQDIARIDQGHTQANVILFENVHALFGLTGHSIVNTFNNIPTVATSTYTFEITFTTPVEQSSISVDKLNFYSIVGEVNSTDRHEIHLAGYQPSSKVLKTSVSYKDENNMVWALMLPTSSYLYPAENVKIFNAYPKFNDWAKSGGKEFTDWYLNPSDSTGLIYNRK